jgi:capsular exopolysaccharide synthesis family protein
MAMAPPPTAAAASGGNSPILILQSMMRHKWWALVVFVLIAGAAIPPIWLLYEAKYSARAEIQVSPRLGTILVKDREKDIPYFRQYLMTQVAIVKSPRVLERVLHREDVRETAWFGPRDDIKKPLEWLMKGVKVRPRRGTEIIDVNFQATDPRDAKVIVDAVVDEYEAFSRDDHTAVEANKKKTLTEEKLRLQNDIDGIIDTMYAIAKDLGTVGPEDVRSQLAKRLADLEASKAQLQREHELTLWELAQMKNQVDGEPDSEARSRPYVLDSEWRRMTISVEQREHELEVALQTYGQSHPHIMQLKTTIEHSKSLVKRREEQLQAEWQGAPTESLSANGAKVTGYIDASTLQHQEARQRRHMQLLDGEIDDHRQRVMEAGDVAQRVAKYEEDLRRKRSEKEQVLTRLRNLEIESRVPGRIKIASKAIEPSKPDNDRRVVFSMAAVFAAFAMGICMAFVRSQFDQRIRMVEDVHSTGGPVPFLGQVPELPRNAESTLHTNPILAESMRMVRTSLMQRLQGMGGRSVLITSSTARAGKTSISIMLARSLAQLGKRVLLVEADLRNPSVSQRVVGFEPKLGLSSVLLGSVSDDKAIMPTDTPNFDMLAAGERQPGFDFERLANGIFSSNLASWKKRYDIVLIDSPPVLPVADARILAGQADGTVMVLRSSHCRRSDVVQAYSDLSAAGGSLMGTILIGGEKGSGYGYGYGYGYGAEPTPEPVPALSSKN